MTDRDMRPTRFDLMLEYAREFVTEWFDQNPLGQIGIVGIRGGLGERIGEMSGTFYPPPPPRRVELREGNDRESARGAQGDLGET
jgi:Ssl1-like